MIDTLTGGARQASGNADEHSLDRCLMHLGSLCNNYIIILSARLVDALNTLTGRDTESVKTSTRSPQNRDEAGQARPKRGSHFQDSSWDVDEFRISLHIK